MSKSVDSIEALSRRNFVISGVTLGAGMFDLLRNGHLQSIGVSSELRRHVAEQWPETGIPHMPGKLVADAPGIGYRYEFGVALHERAFNTASAALRIARPELFSNSTKIPIKPPVAGPAGNAGNDLTLYSIARDPLAFSLAPDAGIPLEDDTFFTQVNISFTLTDSQYGTITRIGAKLQAKGGLLVQNSRAQFRVFDFRVVELRGEGAPLVDRIQDSRIDVTSSVRKAFEDGNDSALGRTFQAIVNYLINLFLEDALKKSITEFPVPPLNDLVKLPGLGVLPLAEARIRNKSLFAFAGRVLSGPVAFPVPPTRDIDLRVAATQQGIDRILSSLTLDPQPIGEEDKGDFRVRGQIQLASLRADLRPASRDMKIKVYFGGRIDIWFQVKIPVLGGYLRAEVPIPIDDLSHFVAPVEARTHVEGLTDNKDARVTLALHPQLNFWDGWYIAIVSNYRTLMSNAFAAEVARQRDRLLGKRFCKIPILGWLVCGTIDVIARVTGYVLGALLDAVFSTFATVLLDTFGRIIAQIFVLLKPGEPRLEVLSLEQREIQSSLGTTIKSAQVEILENGVTSELQLQAWLSDVGLPVPAPPHPLPPINPVPIPPIPPGADDQKLPEYSPQAFLPLLSLTAPRWTHGVREEYEITIRYKHENRTELLRKTVKYEHVGTQWIITQTSVHNQGDYSSLSVVRYADSTFAPISAEVTTRDQNATVSETTAYALPTGRVGVKLQLPGAQWDTEVLTRVGVPIDEGDTWILRLAHSSLRVGMQGAFSKCTTDDPQQFSNWLRIVPVVVTIGQATVPTTPAGTQSVWTITAKDGERSIVGLVAQDGSGLREVTEVSDDAEVKIVRA